MVTVQKSELRQELIESIHRELTGVDDLLEAIDCCLDIMTDEQLGRFRMTLARGLSQTVPDGVYSMLVNEVIRMLRDAGKHLSDEEYHNFVHDVLARVEYSEIPE